MNNLQILQAASLYLSGLEEKGVEVEYFVDFERVAEAAAETGRNFQMPTFRTDRVDHTTKTAFWMFLKKGGQRIGGAAAMLQDIGRETFGSYQTRVSSSHFPNPHGPALEWVSPALSTKMNGRLAYVGELNFDPKHQGDAVLLANFMRLFHVICIMNWDVDWVYAFIPDRHKKVRLDLVYGFYQTLPSAQRWAEPSPEKRSSSEWWVGSCRTEIEHMLQVDVLDGGVSSSLGRRS